MSHIDAIAPIEPTLALPGIRSLTYTDVGDALSKGVDDFRAMPTHVVFLCLIYPIVGLLLGRLTFGYGLFALLYPMAAGFALLGPFLGVGLYELSRRRELGLDTSWHHAFDVMRSPSLPSILLLGGYLFLIFLIWIAVAHALYVTTFGYERPASMFAWLEEVFTTPKGHYLIVVGNLVGLAFAVIVYSLTVVSFPLLLDRRVSAAAAMLTSIRTVCKNPATMTLWALIIAFGLALGSIPLFFGLAVVMPILGHASWHLYRKAIEPDPSPRPEYAPRSRAKRQVAQFPSSSSSETRSQAISDPAMPSDWHQSEQRHGQRIASRPHTLDVEQQEFEKALLDPQSVFETPQDVVHARGLSTASKIEILRRWEYNAAEEAVALEEGMPGQESGLLREILLAIGELGGSIDTERTGPTKQHGLSREAVKREPGDRS
jgi:uncharacterized membrane protein